MKTELLKDINQVTSIELASLERLAILSKDIICHDVYENYIDSEPLSEIDIGIGTLMIKLENDNIRYKFIPSSILENAVKNCITTKESPLITAADKSLVDKIERSYKELL